MNQIEDIYALNNNLIQNKTEFSKIMEWTIQPKVILRK